jgi:hypothetical protein
MTIKSVLYDLVISKRYDDELAALTMAARQHCVERLQPGFRTSLMRFMWPTVQSCDACILRQSKLWANPHFAGS